MSNTVAMKKPDAVIETAMYVTMRIDRQLFGISVRHVRDVLRQQNVIPIPLAPPEVAGSLNLRGRIVTVIDVRCRLNLPAREQNAKTTFVVVEIIGELYSMLVDRLGDVLTISTAEIEKTPGNLTGAWKDIASGIHKMDGELLVLIDVATLLSL
jgi:purine-binding chemotaxis protein CheW